MLVKKGKIGKALFGWVFLLCMALVPFAIVWFFGGYESAKVLLIICVLMIVIRVIFIPIEYLFSRFEIRIKNRTLTIRMKEKRER